MSDGGQRRSVVEEDLQVVQSSPTPDEQIRRVEHLASFLREVAALVVVFGILDPFMEPQRFTFWWYAGVVVVGAGALHGGILLDLVAMRAKELLQKGSVL